MSKIKKYIFPSLIILFIFLIFREWFIYASLSTGDWSYRFPQMISEFSYYPFAWSTGLNNGLGTSGIFLTGLDTYFQASTAFFSNYLKLPWITVEKILWYWPFIFLSITGAFLLFKKLFSKNNLYASISALIFSTNTYALMVTGGGQIGIGLAYSLMPFLFLIVTKILESSKDQKINIRYSLIGGIVFSFQLLLDIRIAYVTLVFLALYLVLNLVIDRSLKFFKTIFLYGIIPGLVTFFLHFFWIAPFVILGSNPLEALGAQYSTTKIVEFLSFAKFENTISLLHPIWPENIFGKVHFMRPEFLLLPILAFYGLLSILKNDKRIPIIIFSLFAIIAAFLSKGSSEPFGQVYLWAFENIPGFQMFRDSTKWYGVIALSYALLIPYSLLLLGKFKLKVNLSYILVLLFLISWVFMIRQNFTGELKGTFSSLNEPKEYIDFGNFIGSQDQFFRTLWVPVMHHYSFTSNTHPAIPAGGYYSNLSTNEIVTEIEKNLDFFSKAGVKYIVIPSDTEGKIFLIDRKYDDVVYKKTVDDIKKIEGIKEVRRFGKLIVFEIPGAHGHFWSEKENLILGYKKVNPVLYELEVRGALKGDKIIFAEGYDAYWYAIKKDDKDRSKIGKAISSTPYERSLNSFILSDDGDYKLQIFYLPQRWVDTGVVVSAIALIIVTITLIYVYKKK